MEQKHIGIILIFIALFISSFIFIIKIQEDSYVNEYVIEEGTCYLDDGTCLHRRNMPLYTIGWIISGAILIFGIYITFFDKTQEFLAKHQIKVSTALESAKKHEKEKDEFKAYLAGFEEDEQKILKAIKDQDGIKQSTLRYKTGISKTTLSLILKKLENKKVISRKESGKTKEIYLIKKF